MSTLPPAMYALPPIVSHTSPMDLPSTMYRLPTIQGGTQSNEEHTKHCEVRAFLKDQWPYDSFNVILLYLKTPHNFFPLSMHIHKCSIEFFKSADIPAFERRQEALLGRLQHLQGSVQKLRESVGLADSSTREVSNHVSGSNFLALHIYWQLERGQKILLGMLSLKLHRSNSFNLIYMQRLSCANNAFTINWAALKITISPWFGPHSKNVS